MLAILQRWTAIHWAVWSNKVNCVKALVALGANIYAVDTVSVLFKIHQSIDLLSPYAQKLLTAE